MVTLPENLLLQASRLFSRSFCLSALLCFALLCLHSPFACFVCSINSTDWGGRTAVLSLASREFWICRRDVLFHRTQPDTCWKSTSSATFQALQLFHHDYPINLVCVALYFEVMLTLDASPSSFFKFITYIQKTEGTTTELKKKKY